MVKAAILVFGCLLLSCPTAGADELAADPARPPPASPQQALTAKDAQAAPTSAPAAPQAKAAPQGAAQSMDFDLFADSTPKLSPAQEEAGRKRSLLIEAQGHRRRKMLLAHQVIGLVTLAGLAATCVVGHLNYYDKYTSGDFTGRYQDAHLYLSSTTSVLFATTGMLALLAPNPYKKPIRFDTALVHKISMAVATAGMAAQIILGSITASALPGKIDQPSAALGHVVVGYATFGFMAVGTASYLF